MSLLLGVYLQGNFTIALGRCQFRRYEVLVWSFRAVPGECTGFCLGKALWKLNVLFRWCIMEGISGCGCCTRAAPRTRRETVPPLSVMIKPSSGNCNMQCDYCFYCDEMKNRSRETYGFMTENTLKNVIRRTMLRAEGHISYAFQGGEPTLRGLDFFRKVMEYQRKYQRIRAGRCMVRIFS